MNSQIDKWFADLGKIFNQSINLTTALSHLLTRSRLSLHLFKITKVSFSCSSPPPHTTLRCTGLSLSLTHCRKIALCVQKIVLLKNEHILYLKGHCAVCLGLYLVSTHLMHKTVNNETPSSKELIIRFRTHKKKSN